MRGDLKRSLLCGEGREPGVFSSIEHCFFFSSRRRHTRFDCDWSSDVCSSDLAPPVVAPLVIEPGVVEPTVSGATVRPVPRPDTPPSVRGLAFTGENIDTMTAADRKSVV